MSRESGGVPRRHGGCITGSAASPRSSPDSLRPPGAAPRRARPSGRAPARKSGTRRVNPDDAAPERKRLPCRNPGAPFPPGLRGGATRVLAADPGNAGSRRILSRFGHPPWSPARAIPVRAGLRQRPSRGGAGGRRAPGNGDGDRSRRRRWGRGRRPSDSRCGRVRSTRETEVPGIRARTGRRRTAPSPPGSLLVHLELRRAPHG